MILLAAALSGVACGAEHREAAAPSAPAPSVPTAEQPAHATRCSAQPSTVYGDEPVVFELEGKGRSGAKLQATLYDGGGRAVVQRAASVPGRLSLSDVPSGDFELRVGSEATSCQVTVNRELSRATPGNN